MFTYIYIFFSFIFFSFFSLFFFSTIHTHVSHIHIYSPTICTHSNTHTHLHFSCTHTSITVKHTHSPTHTLTLSLSLSLSLSLYIYIYIYHKSVVKYTPFNHLCKPHTYSLIVGFCPGSFLLTTKEVYKYLYRYTTDSCFFKGEEQVMV